MASALPKYIHAFGRLKRANTKYGLAPHKPVLLLSLIELMQKGIINENAFFVNADLVGTFKENWQLLVPTMHQPDFTQPFYYLQNEKAEGLPFWFLKPNSGWQINAHIKSVNTLKMACAFACFAADLFETLTDAFSRDILQSSLLDTYFPQLKAAYTQAKRSGEGYLLEQVHDILNEPQAKYRHVSTHSEEDIFVRSELFRQLVPKVYRNQCCFTGMQLHNTYAYNFIDACHIVPFSLTHNDRVSNGLALCPNLHRAFDLGFVGIDQNYQIIVSEQITENEQHPYALKQLAGRKILLPKQEIHHPDRGAIIWHHENVFK